MGTEKTQNDKIKTWRFFFFRDKNGKVVTKCEPEEGLGVDRTPGVACVIRFVNLNDLVKLYMLNVEKPHKYDPFYISDVQINDYVEIPDPWFTYQGTHFQYSACVSFCEFFLSIHPRSYLVRKEKDIFQV